MPKVGDMRMMSGIIHAVARVNKIETVEWWETLCAIGISHTDGTRDVRVGVWTYPTCLRCASL